jgi:hypothetical protein
VYSRTGDVVLGPFYSIPDPVLMAQRLADVMRHPVQLHIGGLGIVDTLFTPTEGANVLPAARLPSSLSDCWKRPSAAKAG